MNKGNFAMSAIRKIGFGIIVLALLSCEQPFKAGLGTVQDYQPPMVELESPSVNAFILGVTNFRGYATDDYQVRQVDIRITNHEFLLSGERNDLFQYTSVNLSPDGKWNIDIDTREFPDDDFLIKLRAFDSENKMAETQIRRFIVKNNPPSIDIEPLIEKGYQDGNLGGSNNLNWNNAYTTPLSFKRELAASGEMVGMITDTIGIRQTPSNSTGALFAPQIRFWQIKHDSDASAGVYYDDSGKRIYIWDPADEIPSVSVVPWTDVDRLTPLSISTDVSGAFTKAQFQYNLPQKSDRIFAFQVRAQSLDGPGTIFTYPRDHWTDDEWLTLLPEQQKENSMVMLYLRAPEEYPSVTIWDLGNITDPADLASGTGKDVKYNKMSNLDPDGDHEFIDVRNAIKKGPFTLRVKTYHSKGIENAWVYFEKTTDPGYRGRFIWDPADQQRLPEVYNKNPNNVVNYSEGIKPYAQWGFFDENSRGAGSSQYPPMRSFIFTYSDDGDEKTSEARYSGLAGNMANIPTDVKDRSKVQLYRGSNWDDWYSRDKETDWEEVPNNRLDDGDYIISVYTFSYSGTRTLEPERINLTIDRDLPEIQLNRVVGGIGQGDVYEEANGVVMPQFSVSDARSRLRTATSTYFPTGGTERLYILVDAAGKTTMDTVYFVNGVWKWPVPSSSSLTPSLIPVTVDGVTWYKNGPIVDSGRFQVSDIYTTEPGYNDAIAGVLPDGGDYWLYVFARDNAFNVGVRAFELGVNAYADRPVITVTGSIDSSVTDPNYGQPNSFENSTGGFRNKFGPSTSIRAELRDDDSLDLGTSSEDSSVKITLVGSKVVPDSGLNQGKIVAYDELEPGDPDYGVSGYIITLDSADVQKDTAFGRQEISGGSRIAVTRKAGTIEQSVLLDKLKAEPKYAHLFPGGPSMYSSLPDGMYKVTITVSDDPTIKLVMPGGTNAQPISATESFWIVVDTKRPQLDQAAVTPASNSYIPMDREVFIEGTVSDENGPITPALVSVVDGNGNRADDIVSGPIALERIPSTNPALWEYKFTIPVDIEAAGRPSGTYTITASFTDRFGDNITRLEQQYMADNEPPKVGLNREIETFERNYPDVIQKYGLTSTPEYAKILTNKVISFTISAEDTSPFDGIRWWLLPYTMSPVTSWDDYPSPGFGARGDIDLATSNFSVYVNTNTADWPDGLYCLYIMAVDAAGNYSQPGANGHRYQQIYLLQDEDKPYFYNITPNDKAPNDPMVVGQTDLVVRGLIMEDDGMAVNNSVRIWFSNNESPHTPTELENILDGSGPNPIANYSGPVSVTTGLNLQGRDLSLNLQLDALFGFNPEQITEGRKHFIIEARDSATNKFQANGQPALSDDRVPRRQHFTFIYDREPPKVVLSRPRTGQTFGLNAGTSTDPNVRFDIIGSFEDGYLSKNENDHYYIWYELESWSRLDPPKPAQRLDLQDLQLTPGVVCTPTAGGTRVDFTIPANVVVDLLDFDDDLLPEGTTHTLTVSVDDKSGKTGRISVTFIKDRTPPTFTFTNIDFGRSLANPGAVIDWWDRSNTGLSEQLWNNYKQDYLETKDLDTGDEGVCTIYYDLGLPTLTGTFEDSISSVATTFQYWIDGETSLPGRTGTVIGSGRNVRWSIPLTKTDGGNVAVDDGIHTIRISVADIPGNMNDESDVTKTPPVYGKDVMLAFRVDSRRPSATIDMTGRRTVYGGNGFNVTGPNYNPNQELDEHAPSEYGGVVFTVRGTASDENIREVQLRIVDAEGNSKQIPVTNDDEHGASTERRDYASPRYTTRRFNTDSPYTTNYPMITLEWTYRISYSDYATWADGSYDVVVVGIDHWGNESEEEVWTFTKDTSGPQIEFSPSLKKSPEPFLGPLGTSAFTNSINILSADTLVIQGSAIDVYSAVSRMESRLERWNYQTTNPANGWEVWDAAANSVITNPNNHWQTIPIASSPNVQWNITVSTAGSLLEEGLYRIRVRAWDDSYVRSGSGGNQVESQEGYVYFFYDRNSPIITFGVDNFISSRNRNGSLEVPVTVTDSNRIKTVKVDLFAMTDLVNPRRTSTTNYPYTLSYPWSAQQEPEVVFTVGYDPGAPSTYLPDGQYRLVVTSEDWAGKPNTVTTNFTLDNTRPTGKISSPELLNPSSSQSYLAAASEILLGGQDSYIRGTSRDESDNGSESGIEAVWYFLGFPLNNPMSSTLITDDQIAQTVLNSVNGFTGVATAAADTGQNNGLFDAAAAAKATTDPGYSGAWFKLDSDSATYEPPPGFVLTSSNVYDWVMYLPNILAGNDIGGLKPYGSKITVKEQEYNTGTPDSLSLSVEVTPGDIGNIPSIRRMPLFLRIADRVGNISYVRRDILFNPNGDIPTTSILNPRPQYGNKDSPRAGAISVDGLARNNWSVNSVAFRVLVDSNPNSDPDGPAQPPPGYAIPTFSNMDLLTTLNGEEELNFIAEAGYGSGGGWHLATLDALNSPEAPWSFIINAGQEITDRIQLLGFKSKPELDSNDMIRVWIEIFVFRGNGTATLMSIGDGGTILNPVPYVTYFYLKKSAPKISELLIGTSVSDSDTPNQETAFPTSNHQEYAPGGAEVRRGRFAIRAALDAASDQHLTEVQIRRVSETTPMPWTTAWQSTPNPDWAGSQYNPAVPGLTLRSMANAAFSGGQQCYLYYHFDSSYTTTDPPTGYSPVNGNAWKDTGGRFTVEIRIRDDMTPRGEDTYTFDIGIDNFAPVADTGVETPRRVAGTNVDFLGRVLDYSSAMASNAPAAFAGNAQATDPHGRVYVWFTRNNDTTFINLDNGRLSTEVTGPNAVSIGRRTNVLRGRTATVSGNPASITVNNLGSLSSQGNPDTRIPYPATSSVGDNTPFAGNAWVREISELRAGPGTRMVWESNRDRDVTWMLNIDTTVLPDGPMTLNYIVMDKVGNASFYQQAGIFVRNKYPQIDRVTLYTDNNGIGAVYTTHDTSSVASTAYNLDAAIYRSQMFGSLDIGDVVTTNESAARAAAGNRGYLNSGFISKNEFIGFEAETSLGNPPLNYRLQYVTRELVQLTQDNLKTLIDQKNAGNPNWLNLYTIAVNGGFGATRWKSVFNVPAATPQIGTHFVLQMNNYADMGDFEDTNAWVWRYRPLISRTDVHRGEDDPLNNIVRPNDTSPPAGAEAGDGFNFSSRVDLDNPSLNRSDFHLTASNKINEFQGTTPENTAFFLIRTWDSVDPGNENDQLYDAVVVGMSVYLTDTQKPVARLYDLNPYTEEAVTGNNIGTSTDPLTGKTGELNSWQTMRNAMNPRGLGQNILRGGLYNKSTNRELLVKSGHIEPKNGTQALQPYMRNSEGIKVNSLGKDTSTFNQQRNADGYVSGDVAANTYADGTSVAQDQVSGRVILRGEAYDDQLIREIRVFIAPSTVTVNASHALYDPDSDTGKSYAILRFDPNEQPTLSSTDPVTGEPVQIQNPYYRAPRPVPGVDAWTFQEMHWKTGHTVEWAYVWDTEKNSPQYPNANDGAPAANVRVWVAVIDHLGNSKGGLANVQETADTNTKNTFTVDIVPYITGFERQQPTYATKRSLQGWYSFFRGETNITALGYNLKGSGNTSMWLYTSSSANIELPTGDYSQADPQVPTKNRIRFRVPETGANSGKIVLRTTGNIEALNHRSRASQSWNKEYFYNTPGSNLWVNRPYAHIWRSQDTNDAPHTRFLGSTALQSPGMVLQYTGSAAGNTTGAGSLHAAWAVYAEAGWYHGVNNNAARTINRHNQNEPFTNTDLSIYQGGNSQAILPNISGTVTYHFDDGNPYWRAKHGMSDADGDNITNGNGTANGGVSTQRWQNARVVRGSSVDNTHFTIYDSMNKNLWYARNTGNTLRIDGGTTNKGSTATAITPSSGNDIAGTTATSISNNAGQYSAIDYVTNGSATAGQTGGTPGNPALTVPVIAYYDQEHDTVRIAVATSGTPGAANWIRRYLLPNGHPLFRGSGKYISIKVDKDNGIHLAFQNTTKSAIVYVYAKNVGILTSADRTTPSTTLYDNNGQTNNFYVAVVDNVVKGGTWTDVSVDNNGNPWIVYGDTGRTGNVDGARIAYYSKGNTVTFNGALTDTVTRSDITGWEAVQVPSQYKVNNDRLNIEVWPPTDRRTTTTNLGTASPDGGWNAAIGYASDMLRIAYFYYPTYREQ